MTTQRNFQTALGLILVLAGSQAMGQDEPASIAEPSPPGEVVAEPAAPNGPLTPPKIDLGMELRDTANGLTVKEIVPSGLAERSGFREADVILAVGPQPTDDLLSFQRQLANFAAGEMVPIAVERDGQPRRLKLRLPENLLAATTAASEALTSDRQANAAAQGLAAAESRGVPSVGSLNGVELPFVDLGWGLENTTQGVLLIELRRGAALSADLRTGDIITAIGRTRVGSPAAVNYELHRQSPGTSVRFALIRDGKRLSKQVRIPETHQPLLLDAEPGDAPVDTENLGITPADAAAMRALRDEIQALKAEIAKLRADGEPSPESHPGLTPD